MPETHNKNLMVTDDWLQLGKFRFHIARGELSADDGAPVALRNQSTLVLQYLARNNTAIVIKEELLNAVWGDTFVTDDSLVQCISEIRRVLGDTNQSIVQTLPRKGYRLNGSRVDAQSSQPTYAHRCSIFIKAFKSISGEPNHIGFAEGLSEDLVTRLSMLRNLDIRAESTGYEFNNRASPPGQTRGDAENVLTGSVRISGDKVRVTTQLLRQPGGSVVFSRRYDRVLRDIFDIQDDIAGQIISETQVALTEGEAARLAYRHTRSVEAWECFHQGILEYFKYNTTGNAAARALYNQALEYDPEYLDARVALAWTHFLDGRSSFVLEPERSLGICRDQVNALLDSANDVPDILQLDAALLVLERDFEQAAIRAEEAYQAGPSFLYTHAVTAWVHLYSGNLEKARDIYREYVGVSPYVADDTLFYLAQCLSLLGEHDEAVTLAEDYRRRVPSTVYGYTLLASAQGLAGRRDAARATIDLLRRSHPSFSIDSFRQHEPFKDDKITEKLVAELRLAGLD